MSQVHLGLSFINQHVLLWLCGLLPVCAILWYGDYKRMRPVLAVIVAVTAGLFVVGIGTWQDTLASLISTKRALDILFAVAFTSVGLLVAHIAAARQPRRRRGDQAPPPPKAGKIKYHHVWTHVIGVIAGTSAALLVADGVNFLHAAGNAPAGAASAFSNTMTRVSSGKAAAAVGSSGLPPAAIFIGAVAVLILGAYFMRRHPSVQTTPRRSRKAIGGPPAGGRPGAPGGPAIHNGAPPAALPRRS